MVQEDTKDDRTPTNATEDPRDERGERSAGSGVNRSYANGRHVLPADLLAAVQEQFAGLLWSPSKYSFFDERRDLVLSLKAKGVPTSEVARLAKITTRRVRQIVRQAKNEGNADRLDAETVGNP